MKVGLKLLTLAMLFAMPLAGCGDNPKDDKKDDEQQEREDEEEEEEEEEGGGGGQSGDIVHKGTQSDPYSVSDAYVIWSEFEAKDSSPECYVSGEVTDTPVVNKGRLQFYITDGVCDEDLYVVNANNIGGSADCTSSTLKKGDEVVVKGAIKAWAQGDDILFELCYEKDKAACELVSINGKGGSGGGSEGGGEGSGGGGGGGQVTGDTVIDFSKTNSTSGTVNGITYTTDVGSNSNKQAAQYNADKKELRLYIGNTITFTGATFTSITFDANGCGETKADGKLSSNVGSMSGFNWSGNASSVTFTVSSGKQVHINAIAFNGNGGGGSGGEEGGGGGSGDVDAVEAVAAHMAEALVGDATAYEYEDGSYYVDYYDDDSASIIAAAEYALSKCPNGFSVYEEVDEYDDDEGGTFAYGSYDDGVSIAIDVYSWEDEGDICVEVEVYEFEYE